MATINLKANGIEEVWAASVWWRDCDPLFTVVGTSKRAVEEKTRELMDEEISATGYDSDYADACGSEHDPNDDLVWSGVHLYSVGTIVDADDDEATRELVESGITVVLP